MSPHWKTYVDKEYLGHWDFPEGAEAKVEIERVEGGELFNPQSNKKSKKPIIYFVGKKKGFVCNSTNANTISSIVGSPMTEKWVGQTITLYVTQTSVGGQTVDCIRVRPKK